MNEWDLWLEQEMKNQELESGNKAHRNGAMGLPAGAVDKNLPGHGLDPCPGRFLTA